MLRAAIVFFILALVGILFGATGVAGISMEVGKILLTVFLILAGITFIGDMITGRHSKPLP